MDSKQYSINTMDVSDLASVMVIEKSSFDHPWKNKKSFLKRIDNGNGYTLYSDDSIAGYILINIQNDVLLIEKMAVAHGYRNRGAGKSMIYWAQELARKHGCSRLSLHVRESNQSAIGLYKKMGFEVTQIEEGFFKKGGGETALVMELHLA